MDYDLLDFRPASKQEQGEIKEFWSDTIFQIRKSKDSAILYGAICITLSLLTALYLFSNHTTFPQDEKQALIIGGVTLAVMLVVSAIALFFESHKLNANKPILFDKKLTVCPIKIRNMRFVMDPNIDWHNGFAEAYTEDGQLISNNALIPTDFAFLLEMLDLDVEVSALMLRPVDTKQIFVIPTPDVVTNLKINGGDA